MIKPYLCSIFCVIAIGFGVAGIVAHETARYMMSSDYFMASSSFWIFAFWAKKPTAP